MNQSTRKLLGTVAILLSLVVWSILGTYLYMQFFAGLPPWALIVFFAIAGFSWFWPATWIIRWMSRP